MRQQPMATIPFAGGFDATPASATATTMDAASTFEGLVSFTSALWSAGYRAAPALMLGLLALVAIPLTALICSLVRWRQRRRSRPRAPAASPELPAPSHRHAFVELLDQRGRRITLQHDMMRIGREHDNDIRIVSKRVHRYHAAIHREEFGTYRITDLAGAGGNGVSVNGTPCAGTQLKDGDLIELGPGRLRFHAGLL
jgi:hypothetical protein